MSEATPQTHEQLAAAGRRLAELVGGYQISAAIGALAKLGVADALADGPLPLAELARRVGADECALARLLAALPDLGLLTVDDEGLCHLGELGLVLRGDVPGSMRRFAVVSTEPWRWAAYGRLEHTLRTGEPGFVAAHGCRLWDYLAGHPDAAASFEESMARIGMARDAAVAATIDLGGVARVVDVGGGRGGLVSALLAANPQLRAVVVDLPGVVDNAAARLREAGVAERSELVAGDFRESLPAGADAYWLSWILHDWDDEGALLILRNCRAAMAPGARLFVVEMVVPEPGQPGADVLARMVRQTDLEMLTVVGGRERSAAEYQALFSGAGLALTRVLPLPNLPWSVIEATAV